MEISKRTVIVVGSATAIGFIGDVLTYSLASKKLTIPKGWQLFNLIALGVLTGIVIDFAVNKIVDSQKFAEEKALDKLVDTEKKKIAEGKIRNAVPVNVQWVSARV